MVKALISELLDTKATCEVFYVNKEGTQACKFEDKDEISKTYTQKQFDFS